MYHTCENSMLGNSTAQPGHERLLVGWKGSWLLLVSLAGESQPSNCSHNHLPSDSGSPLLPCLWTLNVMAHLGSSPHLLICNAITPAKSPWPPTDTSITLRVGNQGIPGSHYSAPEMNTGGIFSSPPNSWSGVPVCAASRSLPKLLRISQKQNNGCHMLSRGSTASSLQDQKDVAGKRCGYLLHTVTSRSL